MKELTTKEINEISRQRHYTKILERKAIKLLGQFAYQKKYGFKLKKRIDCLVHFMKENPNEKIEIVINNNWSCVTGKPRKKELIGGTTFKYMIWAIIK